MQMDGVDPRRLGPALRPKYLTYLPASRDLAWPLLAGDLIALYIERPVKPGLAPHEAAQAIREQGGVVG